MTIVSTIIAIWLALNLAIPVFIYYRQSPRRWQAHTFLEAAHHHH
jgi:hypothetical protein